MKTIKNGRRQFLSNMALLSAGFAIGGPVSMASDNLKLQDDLKRNWQILCEKLEGQNYHGAYTTEASFYLSPCSGHRHEVGKPVCFYGNKWLAVPVYIFFPNSRVAEDMVVTIFNQNGQGLSRQCMLNRYEVEVLAGYEFKDSIYTTLFQIGENKALFRNDSLVTIIIKTSNRPESRTNILRTSNSINQNPFTNI